MNRAALVWALAGCGAGSDPLEGVFEHTCEGAGLVLRAELLHTYEGIGDGLPSVVGGVGDWRRYDLDLVGDATDNLGHRYVMRGYLNACHGGCAVDCSAATQTGCPDGITTGGATGGTPSGEGDYPDGYVREDTWWTPVDEETVATGAERSLIGIVWEGFGTTGDCWIDGSAVGGPYTMEPGDA